MSQSLPMGANATLPAGSGEITVTHNADAAVDVNLTAFLVGAEGKVRSDADMVFFNQPSGGDGSVTYTPPSAAGDFVVHRLSFDLDRLPAGVEKVVVCLTEDAGPGFAAVRGLTADVACHGQVAVSLDDAPAFVTQKGVIVAECYLRQGAAKVRAVWQGYASGLAGLATDHGVQVDDPSPAPTPAPSVVEVTAPGAPASVNFKKVSGQVSLKKGDKPVLMKKSALITASTSWRTGTDYDVYALVWTADGRQHDVAMFGAAGVPAQSGFAGVRHCGDVGRGGGDVKVESIEIALSPDIVAVVPVAYSAQSNGTGSFREYQVSLAIDNRSGTEVTISADNANSNSTIYSCVPGIIRNTPDGVVVEPLELYSEPGSENRPMLYIDDQGQVAVRMDAGPRNDYK